MNGLTGDLFAIHPRPSGAAVVVDVDTAILDLDYGVFTAHVLVINTHLSCLATDCVCAILELICVSHARASANRQPG